MTNFFTGIGSRETPHAVLQEMAKLSHYLTSGRGWTLRSGGAPGADTAFEAGVPTPYKTKEGNPVRPLKHIYLPWKGFNDSKSKLYEISGEAVALAKTFHPNWSACSTSARLLHARNGYQVLGLKLDAPSRALICWTLGGKGGGGTGQAIRIANARDIPVFDFAVYGADYIRRQVVALEQPG